MCTPVPLGMKYGPSCNAEDMWIGTPLDMQALDTWQLVFRAYPKPDMQQLVWHSDQLDEHLKQ